MAYAALLALANTIDMFLTEHATSFQNFLEKFPDQPSSLEGRMREVACEAEDIIEYYMLEQVSSCSCVESGYNPSGKHELQLEKVIDEIVLIAGEVKEIVDSSSNKGVQCGAARSSSSTHPTIREDAMVSFDDYVMELKDRLCGEPSKLQVIPICGMGGIGKTTLAKNVYDDPLILEYFDIRVWVTISQDYGAQRIYSSLLESLKEFSKDLSRDTDQDKVYKILIGRRYLVVMDDIWTMEAWDIVRNVFPDDGNGSRVLLTTRLSDVASYPDSSSRLCTMSLMDEDQSWNLFKKKVFKDEDFPPELEGIGKEIAGNCKGLPLAVVVIAGLLSTVSKNRASWQEIAENVKCVENAEHGQIEEILSLSYTHLPQYLRPCFLYMSFFPEDHEMYVTRLIRLWIAEGFVKHGNSSDSSEEEEGEKCLEDFVKRSLVLVTKRRSDGRIRSCSLHDLMRYLCIRKANEGKFLVNMVGNGMSVEKEHYFLENIRNGRRVSVDSSSLRHLSSFSGSPLHTIICWWYHLLNLDFVKGVRLLRVLDAESVFLECTLPDQLFELFHLRYLAIQYRRGIPTLEKLSNLQTLIIRHGRQAQFGVLVSLGLQLPWCLPQLRHVYFYGTIWFDDPKGTTETSLENLQTLSKVGNRSCTAQILKRIPNVKKMTVECCHCIYEVVNLVHLYRLENLKLCGRRPSLTFTLPQTLKKLSMFRVGIPWRNLAIVGSLPNLEVLKLKIYACDGSTWETTQGEFQQLEFLLIHVSDLKDWKTESSHFPRLKHLHLSYCPCLEIPDGIGEIPDGIGELIEVVGDKEWPLVKSARRIKDEQQDLGNDDLQVRCTIVDKDEMARTLSRYTYTDSFPGFRGMMVIKYICS